MHSKETTPHDPWEPTAVLGKEIDFQTCWADRCSRLFDTLRGFLFSVIVTLGKGVSLKISSSLPIKLYPVPQGYGE